MSSDDDNADADDAEQTSQEKLVGGTGIVRLGELEITITPLSQAQENTLDRLLRKAAEKEAGDHYSRCRPSLDAAAASGFPGDRLIMLKEIPHAAIRKEKLSDPAFWDYRLSPPGVAQELFARGKKETPGLDLKALKAVITDENVDDVAEQMHSIIQAGDPKATR